MADYVKVSADEVARFGNHTGGCQCALCIKINIFDSQLKEFGWKLTTG